jgi:hypothetical protein
MSDEKESGGAEWMQKLWRPAMGWMYMLICIADMIVFPVLWALWQGINHVPITQWNPLTLQGAGLFHIAMGAVLGISAFGRTQEKLAGTAANPTTSGGSSSGFNSPSIGSSTFSTPASGGFGSSGGSFGSTAPSAPSSFGGGGFGSVPATAVNPTPSWGTTPVSSTPAVNASGKKVIPTFDQPAL